MIFLKHFLNTYHFILFSKNRGLPGLRNFLNSYRFRIPKTVTVLEITIFKKFKNGIFRSPWPFTSLLLCTGDLEHGAEIYLLYEDDYQHNNDLDYFKIKLAYNGIHHYLPVIPKDLTNYFDAHQNAMYFLKNAKSALKNFHSQLPQNSSYQKLVKIGYLALTSTATVLTGCNPHTGTTGTAGAASPAVFDFPSDEPLPSKGGRKRKKPDATTASTSQELPGEQEEEEGEL